MRTPEARDVFALPHFVPWWTAETVSAFGSYVTTVALQVLVVITLHGSALDVGLVSAARWLPYLVLGLVVGALVDRRRRRPILLATNLACAATLGAVPGLYSLGWLNLATLLAVVTVFGLLTLIMGAAEMSFLPRVVPSRWLLAANARLDQSAAVAQTSGPVVGGALVSLAGAPLAILVDAVSYVVAAVLILRVRVSESVSTVGRDPGRLRAQIAEGLRWVYRHRTLGPLAVTTHVWFVFNSVLNTVFAPFLLLELRLSAFELGVVLAFAGAGGLVGALLATRLGRHFGPARTVVGSNLIMALGWAVIALVPEPRRGAPLLVTVVALGQLLYGLALGASNANETGYRQAVTPDELQSRTNTTMRSGNRAAIVLGAPLGGALAEWLGYRPTLWIGIVGVVLVAVALAASPFRHATHPA